jgi:glycosyltransferase involved in cell wall biosynthesis
MSEPSGDRAAGPRAPEGRAAAPGVVDDLGSGVGETLERLRPRDLAVGMLTYNNAETAAAVAQSAVRGIERHLPGTTAAIVVVDTGSADGTPEAVAVPSPVPVLSIVHQAPLTERLSVPFHGVPGRSEALRRMLVASQRLGARALVLLEADVAAPPPEWVARLALPVLEDKAGFVAPVYARHRYEGTITNLLLAPLIRALYGRRVRQPFGGQQALSGRLVDHLLIHPQWNWRSDDLSDVWVLGTAIADGFNVWETWLGRRTIRSRTRTTDLPSMLAQTLGAVFAVMHRHQDLWLDVRGSEPLPEVGERVLPAVDPIEVQVPRMIEGFRLGVRDLVPIWEQILAPETLGDVLSLEAADPAEFRFSDDLWARVVYDFAIGFHYDVVYRDHLLRSLAPLYLGRTAAFVRQTQSHSAETTEAMLDAVGAAFERQKPYLTDRWR